MCYGAHVKVQCVHDGKRKSAHSTTSIEHNDYLGQQLMVLRAFQRGGKRLFSSRAQDNVVMTAIPPGGSFTYSVSIPPGHSPGVYW